MYGNEYEDCVYQINHVWNRCKLQTIQENSLSFKILYLPTPILPPISQAKGIIEYQLTK